jgi:hypothetical protein
LLPVGSVVGELRCPEGFGTSSIGVAVDVDSESGSTSKEEVA